MFRRAVQEFWDSELIERLLSAATEGDSDEKPMKLQCFEPRPRRRLHNSCLLRRADVFEAGRPRPGHDVPCGASSRCHLPRLQGGLAEGRRPLPPLGPTPWHSARETYDVASLRFTLRLGSLVCLCSTGSLVSSSGKRTPRCSPFVQAQGLAKSLKPAPRDMKPPLPRPMLWYSYPRTRTHAHEASISSSTRNPHPPPPPPKKKRRTLTSSRKSYIFNQSGR